jgi:predicted RNA binding protein YcfA (HicA-like mRNA interferase family)
VSQYPTLTGPEIIRVLQSFGFSIARHVRTSHAVLVKPGHPRPVPVPIHGGRDIDSKLTRRIIREAGLTPKQFFKAYWDL